VSLRVDGLTVYYQSLRGDVKAVDGATFEIADGEIMGLAGESGCGKSTLGKSLIRLDARMRYVRGRVALDGIELPVWDDRGMNRFRFREVSLIPQYALSALNPTRRIGKMVTELLASRGVALDAVLPELRRRLDLVGLPDDVLQRFPIELSGGMKQRVVMVISSLLDPSLLIADEVTSALDVSTQRAVAELLVEFRDRGFVKSMIVITHDLSVLYQIADTVLVMYAGKLAEKASAEAIVDDAKHPYTDLLLSTLPEVGVRFAERRLQGIPGRPPSLLEPPSGCRFRTRCPLAAAECSMEPPFVEVEPGRTVACWKVAPAAESEPLEKVAGC
jgi:peptide/nickel transport system ATP-binding protein